MAKDGLLVALAFGAHVPAKWARKDGTVFGGVKAGEWDGFVSLTTRWVLSSGLDGVERCDIDDPEASLARATARRRFWDPDGQQQMGAG